MSNLSDVMTLPLQIPETIPNDWSWRKLAELCNPKQWKTISNSDLTETGYRVFGANGFIGYYHEFNHEDETISVTCRGATCGTVNLIPPRTYITGNSMCLDNLSREVSKFYLFYATQYRTFSDVISGSAQPQITGEGLKKVSLPIPPLPEQKKIASILTSVDEVIENTQKQIDKLQDLKKATMNELLTKGIGHTEFKDSELGRIPKSWEVKPLNDICDLQVGYAFKSTWFTQSGIALLRGENVGYGDAKWDASRYLDNDRANEFSQYLLTKGDIVIGMDRTFTKSGSKITRISSKDLPCLLVQRVGRFRSENLGSDFLWQLLRSEPYLNQLAANEKGMDIPHLSKQEILEPIVPLIPKGEQIQISLILKSFDEQSQILLTRRTQTQSLKKSLMQDLLTGKVRVTVN